MSVVTEVAFIWIVGFVCVARKKNEETVNSEMEDSTGLHMMILILDDLPPPPQTSLSVNFIFDVTATLFRLFLFFDQFRTYVTNPFIWDVSATLLSPSSPVLSMNIYDSKGQDIIVSDLTEPIRLQIATGAANENAVRVTPYLTAVLFYHAIEPDWNSTQALSIVLTPDGTNETFELFLKHGSLPTPTDYDLYYRFPEDGYAGSAETQYPEYKIFIRNESVTANDTEVLYLGLRLYGKKTRLRLNKQTN